MRASLVDVGMVSQFTSGNILSWWERFGPGVLKCRTAWSFPRYAVEIEFLAKKIADYAREHPEMGISVPTIMV